MDGMPATELATRKKALISELNPFIAQKKEIGGAIQNKAELVKGQTPDKGTAGRATVLYLGGLGLAAQLGH